MTTRTKAFAAALVPLTLAAGTVVTAAQPAGAAVPAIRMTTIQYDSPGADNGSNTSLNAEWVRITNTTAQNCSLSGWTLKDKQGFTYRFPTFTLKARASVVVHTGKGSATSTNRYYNRSWYVWNNTGDTAYLRDSKGVLKDSWAFRDASAAAYRVSR
ncbi:lamin tail domain-containing protein [Pedococcus sp. KACC 23699]|uniref:Lamin tail domain-containing protein n=1 Tax=Pedococcus sp. KACC 23699 TaxID=3149228 RepID=A0AAU7JWI2_9MICO